VPGRPSAFGCVQEKKKGGGAGIREQKGPAFAIADSTGEGKGGKKVRSVRRGPPGTKGKKKGKSQRPVVFLIEEPSRPVRTVTQSRGEKSGPWREVWKKRRDRREKKKKGEGERRLVAGPFFFV